MVPLKDQIAGIIAHTVESRLKNPGLTVTPEDYARIAQDIIDRVIDDGQYAVQDVYDDMCRFDCTAAHNAIWYKLDHLEARFNEEHDEEEEGGNDMHGVIIDELILLGERIEKLEERLDKAKEAHHNHKLRPWEDGVCSNGGQCFSTYPHQQW